MTKRKKSTKDPHRKMFPASCGHNEEDFLRHKNFKQPQSISSKCSQVARSGCKTCILHYVYTVYKKHPHFIDGAKEFVSECVCYKAQEKGRSIEEVFELLQLCYFAGLGFAREIFECEDRYTKDQLIWLLAHGASPAYINLMPLIKQEKWETILLVAENSPCEMWSETREILLSLTSHVPSSLISVILFYVLDAYYCDTSFT